MRINGRTIVGVEAASRWRKQREDATRKSKQEKAEIASEGETRPG
jgi:hypothetical protein